MNAKVVADLDLAAFTAAHGGGGAVATMLVRDDPDARRWGAIASDETGRVVGILDARSPRPPEGRVTERMFTGVHVVEPALLDRLKPVFSDVIRDAYIPALLAGETIRAEILPGYFAEHSTPERYLEGNLALLANPALVPTRPARSSASTRRRASIPRRASWARAGSTRVRSSRRARTSAPASCWARAPASRLGPASAMRSCGPARWSRPVSHAASSRSRASCRSEGARGATSRRA